MRLRRSGADVAVSLTTQRTGRLCAEAVDRVDRGREIRIRNVCTMAMSLFSRQNDSVFHKQDKDEGMVECLSVF